MINPEHNIIIREGNVIEPAELNANLFSIEGAVSGTHVFKLILADDGKTILLQPEIPFAFNEVVTVTIKDGLKTKQGQAIANLSFNFRTHRAYTAEEHQHFKDLKKIVQEEENKLWVTEAVEEEDDTRQIDGMFDITVNTNPSPGDIFLMHSAVISNQITLPAIMQLPLTVIPFSRVRLFLPLISFRIKRILRCV